jgi:hypothetical protein
MQRTLANRAYSITNNVNQGEMTWGKRRIKDLDISPLCGLLGPEPQHHWREQENIFIYTELVDI